jgi:nitroreductase
MIGQSSDNGRQVDESPSRWSADEIAILAGAVRSAPSVHNARPWSLAMRARTAELQEREVEQLAYHDPEGRDRQMSCGAALTNLVLAVRSLGWAADVDVGVTSEGLAHAKVTGTRRAEPTDEELRRYQAISDRTSYRHAFGGEAVPGDLRDAVLSATSSPTVVTRWVNGGAEALAVARLLDYSARAFHGNVEYQRELSMWTSLPGEVRGESDLGLSWEELASSGLAAVGLTTARTRIPDESVLAARIERESLLVVGGRGDEPSDHVRTGEAVEQAWLEATAAGLAVSIMTQPLHLDEVRDGLADRLRLAAVPQVLMRFGYPMPTKPGNRREQP